MDMHKSIIGDLSVESDGQKLHLTPARGRQIKEIVLDAAGIRELMDFLKHCTEDEFNQRAAFRVPVYSNSGLAAALLCDQRAVPVIARNLSYTGIYVEAEPENDPNLKKGGIVDVELVFDERRLRQRGIIRRRTLNGYGIFFPESIKHEDVNPNPQLKNIVQQINQQIVSRWR